MNVQKAEELLRTWQTWLGSCRDACDEVGKELWDEIETTLEASPTPPAPEVEPVAYGAKIYGIHKWAYIGHEKDDVQGWINLQHQSRDDVTYVGPIPLHTHPADNGLRKAAEAFRRYIDEAKPCCKIPAHLMQNLRAELNK